MSNEPQPVRYREAARYVVELHWCAPRTWGERRFPHAGRFYAWALFKSPSRTLWTYTAATGAIRQGGVETTELAILTPEVETNVPEFQPGEIFELSRVGVEGIAVAARGRVLNRKANST